MTTNVQDNSLTISGTISRDSGFYTCVVTNGLDEERASAILTVKGNWELKISKLQFVSKCIVSDSYLASREQFSSYTMTRTSYFLMGPSWSWSYGCWIYNYLYSQCLSPLALWVRILLRRGVLNTTLYDKVCQWLTAGQCFSLGNPVSSTN